MILLLITYTHKLFFNFRVNWLIYLRGKPLFLDSECDNEDKVVPQYPSFIETKSSERYRHNKTKRTRI